MTGAAPGLKVSIGGSNPARNGARVRGRSVTVGCEPRTRLAARESVYVTMPIRRRYRRCLHERSSLFAYQLDEREMRQRFARRMRRVPFATAARILL